MEEARQLEAKHKYPNQLLSVFKPLPVTADLVLTGPPITLRLRIQPLILWTI